MAKEKTNAPVDPATQFRVDRIKAIKNLYSDQSSTKRRYNSNDSALNLGNLNSAAAVRTLLQKAFTDRSQVVELSQKLYAINPIYSHVIDYMANMYKVCPIAVLNIYLKRISHKLNKKYDKTPIRNLSKIYIISTYNGKVSSVCPKDIKSLKHFAWFRSEKDAEFARKCVIGLITDMFGKDDQSKD